ncbi:hypothetical protein [Acidisoma cladoniae]|uniref:hypothetical protein n=1 Tax=Acidisoma cladoniae TaxID=3040935 RepID=UPI00254DEBD9|nr:hypothetical protein [Acidisoma sp. PAMC 29798]
MKSVNEALLELRAKHDAAILRARNARAAVGRFDLQMKALDRRRTTQRLCTLGRAWEAMADQSPNFRAAGQKFLGGYISRDTDREILIGTPWQLPEPSERGEEDRNDV